MLFQNAVLGGSWVLISGVISPLIWVTSIVTLLLTLLITTHEPPSAGKLRVGIQGILRGISWKVRVGLALPACHYPGTSKLQISSPRDSNIPQLRNIP